MTRKPVWIAVLMSAAVLLLSVVVVLNAQVTAVKDDPLVRMPGTQPGQVALEDPNRCLNCHAGYNSAVEPGFNWMGSMMAQSARDFLFFSALTVAAQDAKWATTTPENRDGSTNATDLCLRCHFPKGWLEGRSDPTNASLMSGADWDGVQCDFCHSMWDPQFEATHSDQSLYWDETGLDAPVAAEVTYAEDQTLAQTITFFNGTSFFNNNSPPSGYTEGTGGQYFVTGDGAKRASFVDAEARHQMLYSRYHKSKYFCGTCHDVSNPVLQNLNADPSQPLPSEVESAHNYMHVERTFSEFMLSAYGQEGGAFGLGPFAPDVFETSTPDNKITMCQDCHMRDVVGTGADKRGIPVRPDDSADHPNSGQPLHDMTGGNIWVPWVLASSVPGSPNYRDYNDTLLNQGAAVLTLDLQAGQGLNPEALLAGVDRARQQLELAAAINNLSYDTNSGLLSFQVQNQTGHKLISGFPEGRRMFVNVKVFAGGQLVYEVNPYDYTAGTLKGLSGTSTGTNETYVDELVYEMHPSSTLTGEEKTLHFVLADGREKDNRIPPQGFSSNETLQKERLVQPVWHGTADTTYFTDAEYAGGYDDVRLVVPVPGADSVEVSLYYQTTSREYVEFLRDEINGTGNLTLPSAAYVAQTDPFFTQLAAWGDALWQLWEKNKDVPGAAPFLMAQASAGSGTSVCTAPDAPSLVSAVPANGEVTITWSEVPAVDGYRLYYDQADKTQLVVDLSGGTTTTYTDTGLTNGQQVCYVVSAYNSAETGTCESAVSAPLCATPNAAGQIPKLTVDSLITGILGGRGNKNFQPATEFVQGDEVVIRASTSDVDTGLPVAGAVVTIHVELDGATAAVLSGSSDQDGLVEVKWLTVAPSRKKTGTPVGIYDAVVSSASASGYIWDGVSAQTSFVLSAP